MPNTKEWWGFSSFLWPAKARSHSKIPLMSGTGVPPILKGDPVLLLLTQLELVHTPRSLPISQEWWLLAPISEGDSVLLPPDSILQSLRDRKCLIKLISARNLHHFLHCILRLIIRLCTSSNAVYGGTKVFQEILVDLKIPIILKGTKLRKIFLIRVQPLQLTPVVFTFSCSSFYTNNWLWNLFSSCVFSLPPFRQITHKTSVFSLHFLIQFGQDWNVRICYIVFVRRNCSGTSLWLRKK